MLHCYTCLGFTDLFHYFLCTAIDVLSLHATVFVILQDNYEVNRSDAWEIPQQITTKEIKTATEALPTEIFSIETQGLNSQIEEAKKDIAEKAKKYGTEIVEYAAQEIRRCKESTLNYIEDDVEANTAETWKRRIEILQNAVEDIQQAYNDSLSFVIDGLQNYKKETLTNIEEDAVKQIEKTLDTLAEKVNNVTMEDLVHLIEQPLNQILKDTRQHAVQPLDTLIGKLIEYLKSLDNKIKEELAKEISNEELRYKEKLMKILEEKIPKHFIEGLELFHDELEKREEEAVEHFNREAVQRCEEEVNRLVQEVPYSVDDRTDESEDQGRENVPEKWRVKVEKCIMEEMHRKVKAMRKRVKEKTEEIQTEALHFLSHEVERREDVSLQKKLIEMDPITAEIIQKLKERSRYTERKYKKLFKEANKYIENVNERVREHAVKRVADMVALIVQETLRSALKSPAGSEQNSTMESSPKWVTEALFSLLKSFQPKQVSRVSYLELAG